MILLFDVGGTKTRLAISENGETFSSPLIVATYAGDDEKGIAEFMRCARELIGEKKLSVVVGGFAGTFDRERTRLFHATNIRGWENIPLKQRLESEFGCPVRLENDSALAALGEAIYGAGKGADIVAYITVSTGVGGARVVKGIIDPGVFGFEPAYQIVDAAGCCDKCKKNHLGAHISGRAIADHYGKPAEEINDPAIWSDIAKTLSYGLCNTIVHWSPDAVVLGGGVMQSIPLEQVETHLKEILTVYPELPKLVRATLGDSAGLWGGLALSRQISG